MENNKNTHSVKELKNMISEQVRKQTKIKNLMESKKRIEDQLNSLLKEYVQTSPAPAPQTTSSTYVGANGNLGTTEKNDKQESIFDTRPNETIIFNFQDVTIKVQRQLDDMFKVVDANESKKLKVGDYIKIQGNDILQQGREFKFAIYRDAGVVYQSNPLMSWRIIKNR